MAATPWQDWLLWLGGCVLLTAGVGLVLWSLFRDRTRGKRRCPRCWYEMAGVPGLTCPECGRTAPNERRLRGRRRRWRLATVGLLGLAVGTAGVLAPHVRRHGFRALVPTTLLVSWLDAHDDTRPLTGLRMRLVAEASAELRRRYWRGALSERHWRRYAVNHPSFPTHVPLGTIRTRSSWPEGAPLRITINADQYQGECHARDLLVTAEFGDGKSANEHIHPANRTVSRFPRDGTHDVGVPPAGATAVSFRLDLFELSRSRDASARRIHLWSGRIEVPVTVGGAIDEHVEPVRDERITQALREHLRPGLRFSELCGRWFVDIDAPPFPRFPDVLIALRIELVYGDRVVGTGDFGFYPDAYERESRSVELTGNAEELSRADFTDPLWKLRVRGSGEVALRALEARRFWAAELEFPVSDPARPDNEE